eukprot:7760050-Alexandrium_andersonii.AAC.1
MACRRTTGSTWPNSARTLAPWKRSMRPTAKTGASSRAESTKAKLPSAFAARPMSSRTRVARASTSALR